MSSPEVDIDELLQVNLKKVLFGFGRIEERTIFSTINHVLHRGLKFRIVKIDNFVQTASYQLFRLLWISFSILSMIEGLKSGAPHSKLDYNLSELLNNVLYSKKLASQLAQLKAFQFAA